MPRRPADTGVDLIDLLDPSVEGDAWAAWRPAPSGPDAAPDRPEGGSDATGGVSRRALAWVAAGVVVVLAVVAVVAVSRPDRPAPQPWAGRYVIDGEPVTPFHADATVRFGADGGFRVWAAGGPDEPSVLVQAMAGADVPPVVFDGSVRMVNGVPLIDVVGDPDVVVVSKNFGHGDRVLLRARGLSDQDVARISNSLVLLHSAGRVVDVDLPDTSMARLGLREESAARWRDQALFGDDVVATRWIDHVGSGIVLRAGTGDLDDSLRTLGHLAGAAPTRHGDRWVAIPTDTGEPVVLWEQDGRLMSLQAPGDPGRLLAWSRLVRPMREAEWVSTWAPLPGTYTEGPVVTLASGFRWAAAVQRADLGRTMAFRWQFTDPGNSEVTVTTKVRFRPSVMPFADRIVVGRTTYVFVSMPVAARSSTAVVRYGDGRSTVVPLRKVFDDLDVAMGALRVDEPGPISVLAPVVQGG